MVVARVICSTDSTNCGRSRAHQGRVRVQATSAVSSSLAVDDPRGCPERLFQPVLLSPIAFSTICPWYYVETVNFHRIPTIVAQAVCRCGEDDGCLTWQGRDTLSQCVPITRLVTVLRLNPGVYPDATCLTLNDYHLSHEEVAVACVCKPKR